MNTLTPEQIAELCDSLEGRANITSINKLFREQDESHLWPVNNEFNATDRAIRRCRDIARANGAYYGLEYAYMIDAGISNIVNNCY